MTRTLTRLIACLAITAPLTALSASSALADAPTACDGSAVSQPFAAWGDDADYMQAPGGTFEAGGPAWSLSGGAHLASGNESYDVSGPGTTSLTIPAGGSAQSPSFCAGLAYPDIRLFAHSTGGLLPLLHVDVIYTDHAGLLAVQPLGLGLPSASWQPSLPSLTLSGLPLLTGSRIALRFTAIGGSFSIDDVYVDPFQRMR